MSSWILHCGSQFKNTGQSNVDFDLNLNQTLEFPDETKCSIMNLSIPTSVPNVCDSFDNRTWKFKFRMYALPTLNAFVGGTANLRSNLAYTVPGPTTAMDASLLHSEYEMTVLIPEGNYQQSDADLNFTESTNIPQVAGNIGLQATSTAAVASALATDDGSFANTTINSQMLIPSHRYGVASSGRNRTYAEALQYAIWHTQQNIRFSIVKGTDVVPPSRTITWTNPAGASAIQLAANETYKLRILKYLISEMNITVNTNANHQLNFIFRSNFAQNQPTGLASNINLYLANQQFLAGGVPVVGAPSGQLTTSIHVNPWMQTVAQSGIPTHFVQCQITAPANVRYKGRTVSNCLDFYNLQYRQTLAAHQGANLNISLISGDAHYQDAALAAAPPVRCQEGACYTGPTVIGPTDLQLGNFTPYGLTWTGFSIGADRTDSFKGFVKQDGTDGWFGCAYFGVRQSALDTFDVQAVYMYAPVFQPPTPTNTYLQYINDVQVNHVRNTATLSYADAGAVGGIATVAGVPLSIVGTASNGNLTLYPSAGANIGVSGDGGFISGVFTGYSVFVTSAQIVSPALSAFGTANLISNLYNLHGMDCESHPTFIIEIEMMGIGNHMKFTGSGECKRMKIIKRIPLSGTSYGGFLRSNIDSQSVSDYGTCLGLSKVSSIKCRVLNEKGEVLKFSQPDTFPPWTFSLCFEC